MPIPSIKQITVQTIIVSPSSAPPPPFPSLEGCVETNLTQTMQINNGETMISDFF